MRPSTLARVPFLSATYFSADTGSVQNGRHSCTSLHNQIFFKGHMEERAETKKKKTKTKTKKLLGSANLHFLKTYMQEG